MPARNGMGTKQQTHCPQVHDPYFNLDVNNKKAKAGIGLGFGIEYSSSTAMVTLVDSLSNFTTKLDAKIGAWLAVADCKSTSVQFHNCHTLAKPCSSHIRASNTHIQRGSPNASSRPTRTAYT